MELLVRMRKGLPDSFIRLTNSGAPGTGTPSWTRTPSMSVSQLSMALRSGIILQKLGSRCGRAAVRRALVPDRQRTEPLAGLPGGAFLDQFAHHRHESGVGARRRRPGIAESELLRRVGGLVVEVP